MDTNALVGRGWAFPVQVSGGGGIALAGGGADIDEAITSIIGTNPGERAMRPDFGCRIHELLFAPANSQTMGLAQRYVKEAIDWWEPRVDVLEEDIVVSLDPLEPARMLIAIRYTIRATKDERSLVYPFYLINRE